MPAMDPGLPHICIVAALAENRAIGRGNRLPWHLPADLAHFKRLTLDKPIVMGRGTWESLPNLLPRRRHIVVTRQPGYSAEGCIVVGSPEAALSTAAGEPELMVIGGAALYRHMLPMARRMYLTLVKTQVDGGDAFFPEWDSACWGEIEREDRPRDGRNPFDLSFVTLVRTGPDAEDLL